MFTRALFLSLLVASLVAFLAPQARASILFGPAVTYQTLKASDQTGFLGGDSSTSALTVDGHLGILIEGTSLYVGGLYTYESSTPGSTSKMTGGMYGPTVGLFSGAFALLGTYIMGGSRDYTISNVAYKISNAQGYRVDMSYVAGLTGSIGVGPQLTYRDVRYSQSQTGSNAVTSDAYQEAEISPALVFWFRF